MWLEIKQLTRLQIIRYCEKLEKEVKKLKEENENLKDKIEFLTQCLDDRDKSIEIMKEENRKLKHKNELQEKALIRLCLKHHYDSIIIDWEEVIDMSNYEVVEKQKPQEEKLF